MAFELVRHGKVKDFFVDRGNAPTDYRFGTGKMGWYEDKYSLFDYGRFPQEIPGKADAMYKETVHFFDLLNEEGIPNHFVNDMGNNEVMVRVARIPPNYGWIKPGETGIYLIPIEVVFSQYVTPVASLHGRLRSGKVRPEDYGLDHAPGKDETIVLDKPRVTMSTKIETVDRYESEIGKDLGELAGLVGNEKDRLREIALVTYDTIKRDAEDVGIIVADGKIECLMGPGRNIYVGDSCLTWDENRLLHMLPDGRYVDLSKQFPRNIYTINGYKAQLKEAQKEFPEDKSKWPKPPLLSDEQLGLVAEANAAVRKSLLREREGPEIKKTARKVQNELDRLMDRYKRDVTGELM